MIQSVSMICQIHVSMSSCPESNLIPQFRMATIFQRTIFEQMEISDSDNPIHMLEGARGTRVQLARPGGGGDRQVGAEQVVVADPDEVAEPVRLG